jgi:hypothetical protein
MEKSNPEDELYTLFFIFLVVFGVQTQVLTLTRQTLLSLKPHSQSFFALVIFFR